MKTISVLSYYYSKFGENFLKHVRIDNRNGDTSLDLEESTTIPYLKKVRYRESLFLTKLGIGNDLFFLTDDFVDSGKWNTDFYFNYWLTGIDIDITDLNGIVRIDSSILEMSGNLIIDSENFSDFGGNLWKVGSLTISDKCRNVKQVDNIAWVSNDVNIELKHSVSDTYFPAMEHIGGNLTITAPATGSDIGSLGNLGYVNKDMRLTNCTRLVHCNSSLNVSGTVYLKNCTPEIADILTKNKNTVVIL
jgi:hypothetical protein